MKKIFKKISIVLFALTLIMSSLVGCGSSSSGGSGSSSKKILFAFHDEGSSYLSKFLEVASGELSQMGYTYDVVYCEKNTAKQKEQIEAANGQYAVIVCRLADASTALQMEAAANGTPIVFINNKPGEDYLKANQYVYVASYEQDAGTYQAEYIWNGLGKPTTVNAIVLKGQKGHSAVAPRTDAIKYFFWDNQVEINLVFADFMDWSGDTAYKKLDVFKNTNQSFDCIFSNNDAMALSAIQWLKDNGYDTSKILVAGLDGSSDGCQAILDGDMYMTVLQDTEAQSKAAMQAVQALAKGKDITDIEGATEDGKFIWVPFVAIDKNNAKSYL
ncbi:inositol transport system substrate-binding protein [Pseudobutyrivibrio sp. YE44]|uniref:substrate-binding domain-containing protein n=1 Tax=Pseudobutyrivibrio sp. YE44 TaxID=1520802 RepID=UPI00088BC528|nr:substrate-binding domain-containing protein [Pseudobutyrivibrio sp. YE44]SDB25351.1 inositol transport system substrate-binding protein [Pseudobutyrivibrio sp. YE44]